MHNILTYYTQPSALNQQNVVSLSTNRLRHNYKYLSSLNPKISIAPVLKSNAYGHGLIEIATMLDDVGAPFFCINSFSEAYVLWKNRIKTPVHIMGYVDPKNLEQEIFPFSYTTYNYEQLEAINKYQPGADVHIFVDTGMHREGFRIDKLPTLLNALQKFPNLKIVGLMSHFASGDRPESEQTRMQLNNFHKAKETLLAAGIKLTWEHIAASTGLLSFAEKKNISIGNLARVGKALYGIDPRGLNKNLKPILKLTSKIVQIKTLKPDDRVGYDGTFRVFKPLTIGVLPIGYYDGVDRRLSNKGHMIVTGIPCPIVGRVSMNITTIDITGVKQPKVGQEVTVISDNPSDPNSVENIAKICDTIPYDVVVHLAPTLARRIV